MILTYLEKLNKIRKELAEQVYLKCGTSVKTFKDIEENLLLIEEPKPTITIEFESSEEHKYFLEPQIDIALRLNADIYLLKCTANGKELDMSSNLTTEKVITYYFYNHTIHWDIFSSSFKIKNITFHSEAIIGPSSFYRVQSLENIYIEKGLKEIGSNAFYQCNNLTVTYKNTVYSGSSLKQLNTDLENDGCIMNGEFPYPIVATYTTTDNQPLTFTSGFETTMDSETNVGTVTMFSDHNDFAISDKTKLQTVLLLDNFVISSTAMFKSCSSLVSVVLPEGLIKIPSYTFHSCSKLAQINIPSTVTTISDYCFTNNYKLTSINIPDSVISLGNYCFLGCSTLTDIVLSKNLTIIPEYCFYNCSSFTSINFLPDTIEEIKGEAFYGIGTLSNPIDLDLPKNLKILRTKAFDCCYIKSITLYENIETCESNAFYSTYTYSNGKYIYTYRQNMEYLTLKNKIPTFSCIGTYNETFPVNIYYKDYDFYTKYYPSSRLKYNYTLVYDDPNLYIAIPKNPLSLIAARWGFYLLKHTIILPEGYETTVNHVTTVASSDTVLTSKNFTDDDIISTNSYEYDGITYTANATLLGIKSSCTEDYGDLSSKEKIFTIQGYIKDFPYKSGFFNYYEWEWGYYGYLMKISPTKSNILVTVSVTISNSNLNSDSPIATQLWNNLGNDSSTVGITSNTTFENNILTDTYSNITIGSDYYLVLYEIADLEANPSTYTTMNINIYEYDD